MDTSQSNPSVSDKRASRRAAKPEAQISPGERALMLAVLEDAIRCYLRLVHYDRTNPEILARQAEYWIKLEDWDSPFSFNNICEAVGLNSQETRTAILGWVRVDPEEIESRIRLLHAETVTGGRAAL